MSKFVLLKQGFYYSKHDRYCDGYKMIMKILSSELRKELDIKEDQIQEFIKKDEKYIYRVGKENGVFKTVSISINNYKIIRKHYKYFKEKNENI